MSVTGATRPSSRPVQSGGDDGFPTFCAKIARSVSKRLPGPERVRAYGERVEDLGDGHRRAIHARMRRLVRAGVERGASDIDLGGPAAGDSVWFRIDGRKRRHGEVGAPDLDALDVFLTALLTPLELERLVEECAVDFTYGGGADDRGTGRRLRANLYFDRRHLAMNMRIIREETRSLSSLGFDGSIQRKFLFDVVRDGLTLVTGVTGMGKSTTLDAIIDANNEHVPGHIVLVADPVEYVHRSKKCLVRHRQVSREVRSFKDGVVQAMRQDPDMIVIGEMRELETIEAALEAADTGHRVYSTLHTSSAVETIDRIVAEYPPSEQHRVRHRLADTLRGVISQKLCPKPGGGRVLAKEVLWMDASVASAVKNGNTGEIYQMMWGNGSRGWTTLEQDLARLARKGEITPQQALSFANRKGRLQRLLA